MRPGRDDTGLTVIELAVAAASMLVVLTAVASLTLVAVSTTRETTIRTGNSRQVRGAAEVVSTALRVGVRPYGEPTAVVEGRPDDITFYALLNRTGAVAPDGLAPTRVRYHWDAATRCLTQTRVIGDPIAAPVPGGPQFSWTGPAEVRCVMTTTTPPAFSYYDSPRISVAGAEVLPLAVGPSGLSVAQLARVRSVQVVLTAQDPVHPEVRGATVLDRVTLGNVS